MVLRSSNTDFRISLVKTINDQKAYSYRGAELGLEMQVKQIASLKLFKDELEAGAAFIKFNSFHSAN